MGFTEKVKVVFDVESTKGVSAIKGLRQSVSEADGAFGKMKAATGGAAGLLQQFGAQAAIAGAAAAVAFGVKALGAFQDMAIGATEMGKATGIAVEPMSRLIAVADDMNVSAEGLGTGLKALGKAFDAGKVEAFGVATKDATGNMRPMNEVFVDVLAKLGAIPEGTERARQGVLLFGKGWEQIAPMVGKTKVQYDKMLASVEKGQVITAKESKTAEDMRVAQDALHDAIQEVTLAVGGLVARGAPLVKFFAQAVSASTELIDKQQAVVEALRESAAAWGYTGDSRNASVKMAAENAKELGGSVDQMIATIKSVSGASTEDAIAALNKLGVNTDSVATSSHTAAQNIDQTAESAREARAQIDKTAQAIPKLVTGMGDVSDASAAARDEFDQTTASLDAFGRAYDTLMGKLDQAEGFKAASDSIDDLSKAQLENVNAAAAVTTAQTKFDEAMKHGTVKEQRDALIELKDAQDKATEAASAAADQFIATDRELANTVKGLGDKVPAELKTKMIALIDQGSYDHVKTVLKLLEQSRHTTYFAAYGGAVGGTGGSGSGGYGGAVGTDSFRGAMRGEDLGANGFDTSSAANWFTDQTQAAEDSVNTVNDAEIHLAQNQLARGRTTLAAYKALVDAKLAASDAANGEESDQSVALFQLQQSIAAMVVQQERDKQSAMDDTIAKIKELQAAARDQANEQVDLAEAITAQQQAQDAFNAAVAASDAAQHNAKASADDRAAAYVKVKDAQVDLDNATIAGAKARAALVGDVGTKAYDDSLASQLTSYAATHGDPTGALGRAAARSTYSGGGFASTTPSGFRSEDLAALTTAITSAVTAGLSGATLSVGVADMTLAQQTRLRGAT